MMYDCPPSPPACTEAWNSAQASTLPSEGTWPNLTLRWVAGTGADLPPEACDIVGNSVWQTLDACLGNDPDAWGWELVAGGLVTPADGSGQVSYEVEATVHLRDWNYGYIQHHAVTFRCARANHDGLAVSLTCPESPAPRPGGCWGYALPEFYWPHDLDGSGVIDTGDLLEVLGNFGAPWDTADMLDILERWGQGSPWT